MSKCWLQITSGSGPEECCRAVGNVYREITAEAGGKGISVSLIHAEPGRVNGNFKSLLLSVDGDPQPVETFCRSWRGTVQWIWQSEYRPHHKRKNWFVGVEPLTPPDNQTRWKQNEIRIETCRSGGPGGQHVNKTESAVRVIHLPTGFTAAAGEERSQHMNKKLALARLDSLFREKHRDRQAADQKKRWEKHWQLDRGNSIRVYKGNDFTLVNRDRKGDQEND